MVYAAERLPELLAGMSERDLTPVRLRAVHPFVDRAAVRVLVEAHRGSRRPLTIEPPLVLHEGDPARFTDETTRAAGTWRLGATPPKASSRRLRRGTAASS